MPSESVKIIKLTILRPLAETQKKDLKTLYGADLVEAVIRGIVYIVSHNPFEGAIPLSRRCHFLVATSLPTHPAYKVEYVFEDGSTQRAIVSLRMEPYPHSSDDEAVPCPDPFS